MGDSSDSSSEWLEQCAATRVLVFDTETTGLGNGASLVEIASAELSHGEPTGIIYHRYACPPRPPDPAAVRVHGLTMDMLKGHPPSSCVARDFIVNHVRGDGVVVAHNAPFDVGLLRREYSRHGVGRCAQCPGIEDHPNAHMPETDAGPDQGNDQVLARVVCSMLLARHVMRSRGEWTQGRRGGPKLSEACATFGVKQPDGRSFDDGPMHTALWDAVYTADLVLALLHVDGERVRMTLPRGGGSAVGPTVEAASSPASPSTSSSSWKNVSVTLSEVDQRRAVEFFGSASRTDLSSALGCRDRTVDRLKKMQKRAAITSYQDLVRELDRFAYSGLIDKWKKRRESVSSKREAALSWWQLAIGAAVVTAYVWMSRS